MDKRPAPACHLRMRWRRWRSAGVWAGAAGQCRRLGWAGSPSLVLCLHRHQLRSAIEVTITSRTCWLTHNTCYPLLLDPPNQKSFNCSAHDISIPLLFSIYESRSKYHTPFTVSTGIAKWSGHRDCTAAGGCTRVTSVHRTRGLETGDHC